MIATQVGFFTFFVMPMYQCLAMLTPMPEQIAAMNEVIEYWKAQLL